MRFSNFGFQMRRVQLVYCHQCIPVRSKKQLNIPGLRHLKDHTVLWIDTYFVESRPSLISTSAKTHTQIQVLGHPSSLAGIYVHILPLHWSCSINLERIKNH